MDTEAEETRSQETLRATKKGPGWTNGGMKVTFNPPISQECVGIAFIHFYSRAGRHLARVTKMCVCGSCAKTVQKPLRASLAKASFVCLVKSSHHTEGSSRSRTSSWGPGVGWEAQATVWELAMLSSALGNCLPTPS